MYDGVFFEEDLNVLVAFAISGGDDLILGVFPDDENGRINARRICVNAQLHGADDSIFIRERGMGGSINHTRIVLVRDGQCVSSESVTDEDDETVRKVDRLIEEMVAI